VLDREGARVHAHRVTTGVARGDSIEITSGIAAGDQIAVAGQQRVRDGARVQLASQTMGGTKR
jgi:membrane fusion protein (multidrug efflux system)